jgi:hypothetical protein
MKTFSELEPLSKLLLLIFASIYFLQKNSMKKLKKDKSSHKILSNEPHFVLLSMFVRYRRRSKIHFAKNLMNSKNNQKNEITKQELSAGQILLKKVVCNVEEKRDVFCEKKLTK